MSYLNMKWGEAKIFIEESQIKNGKNILKGLVLTL